LAGDGKLNVSNPEGSLRFAGVHGLGTGERLLILRSSGANTNHLADVNGSNTCISIEKQGSGVWRLTGNFKPKGDIAVKEGTLVLDGDDVPRRYSWFRFSAKELLDPSQTAVTMQDIALYDELGRRCNEGLVFETPDPYPTNKYGYCECDMVALKPGHVQYGIPGYYKFDVQATAFTEGKEADLRRLFDDISSGTQSPMSVVRRCTQNQVLGVSPSAGDPSSWFTFVMRLPDGAPEIVAYDISRGSGSDTEKKRHPVKFQLEGSEDGFRWDVLHDTEAEGAAQDVSTGGYRWYSDDSAFEKSTVLRPGKGFRFSMPDSSNVDGLSNVRTMSVASGAKFVSCGRAVIRRLAVDANGAGTLEGFEFGEGADCTLDVRNAAASTFDLPGEYVNVTGMNNLSKWTLSFGGVEQSSGKWAIAVRNGKITVFKRSLKIIIR
jgi:autotransporter-associated beta strand protein